MKNVRNMHKIIEKDCFLEKTFIGKETKKYQERLIRLIRAGVHIRDNTVMKEFLVSKTHPWISD